MRTSESKGHEQVYDFSCGFGFEVPTRTCRNAGRNFKSTTRAYSAGWRGPAVLTRSRSRVVSSSPYATNTISRVASSRNLVDVRAALTAVSGANCGAFAHQIRLGAATFARAGAGAGIAAAVGCSQPPAGAFTVVASSGCDSAVNVC